MSRVLAGDAEDLLLEPPSGLSEAVRAATHTHCSSRANTPINGATLRPTAAIKLAPGWQAGQTSLTTGVSGTPHSPPRHPAGVRAGGACTLPTATTQAGNGPILQHTPIPLHTLSQQSLLAGRERQSRALAGFLQGAVDRSCPLHFPSSCLCKYLIIM